MFILAVGWIAVIFDRMVLYVFLMIGLNFWDGSIKNKMAAATIWKVDMVRGVSLIF